MLQHVSLSPSVSRDCCSSHATWPVLLAGFAPWATSMLCSALPGLVSETEHELQRDFSQWPPALFALFLAGSRQASSHEMHK